MVADPTLADTATATLRGLRAHGLLPVLVRELTEPTPYGPDGDEGDGRDVDLEEKLIRCARLFDYVCMFVSLNSWVCRLLHTYVSGHGGMFGAPEKKSLRTFLDARRGTPGEGELGLGADELRELESALT
jgi:hsp70-interacting protein